MAYFNDDNLTEQMCIRSYTQVPVPKTTQEFFTYDVLLII